MSAVDRQFFSKLPLGFIFRDLASEWGILLPKFVHPVAKKRILVREFLSLDRLGD